MVEDHVVPGAQVLGEPAADRLDDGTFALEVGVLGVVDAVPAVEAVDFLVHGQPDMPRSARARASMVLPEPVLPTSSTASGSRAITSTSPLSAGPGLPSRRPIPPTGGRSWQVGASG